MSEWSLQSARAALLAELRELGITDERVLDAMARIPREEFVPPELVPYAYEDRPLPIGHGQTVSQPYIVALTTQAMAPQEEDRALEVGTGSGYQAAVLARLCRQVFTVERLPQLLEAARRRLAKVGCHNVQFRLGDGTKGWPEEAPFDGIVVTAAAPQAPPSLVDQLAEGGRMVIPLGDLNHQDLWLLVKRRGRLERRHLCPCTFVPLIGEEGWH
ncbi:MAG: protein-L-isoaspartate(D-aspartate) O-methyltransferase [Candidatus Bipolaricaulaceae bacterium]